MAYLNCPNCGLTMFDRNPLMSPRRCPRCARRGGRTIELVRISSPGAAAAASLLGGIFGHDVRSERPD